MICTIYMYVTYLGCSTNQRTIPLGYKIHLMVQCHQVSSSVFSGVFIAKKLMEEIKGTRDTTTIDVQTLLDV